MISFNEPASDWSETFPLGNGRLGASIFGAAGKERVQLNQDSIWYGGFTNRCNKDALANLPRIRQLIMEEHNISEAERLMTYALSGTPQSQRPYQSAGDLWINWTSGNIGDYKRWLDLETATAHVTYKDDEDKIEKEYFISYPSQIMAIKVKSSRKCGINASLMLTRQRYYDGAGALSDDMIAMWGGSGEGGVKFVVGIKAMAIGGTVRTVGEHLLIENADEAVIYLAIETSFYNKDKSEKEDLEKSVVDRLSQAEDKGYEAIREEHIIDYQSLYKRVDFEVSDNEYLTNYFNFGRYLSIASSRQGSLPANLQGIWNESMTPPWDSKFTININLEMNYWHIEGTNLSECHMPLFEHLKRMWDNGRYVAETMYGCRGFVAHHNTDIWGDCAPQDIYLPATYWVMGAAWLSTHIWKHYEYTFDKAFLREMYPILKDAVLFFHDFLVEYKGKMITCPSVSPENTYIMENGERGRVCAGATMDNEILYDLFTDYLKASEVLGIEDEMVDKSKDILSKIETPKIGKYGQIMEWQEDYDEADAGHRHISHLYALYPSGQITLDKTPELAKAAKVTLKRRLDNGGGHTGWSCAWIVCFYARLGDADMAWKNLQKLFEKSTFPNYMCNHPLNNGYVFQIDGNFGATAAIVEMLLQSDEDRTIFLPALPDSWKVGHIRGVVMYGGAAVDMGWDNNVLTECVIHVKNPINTKLVYKNKVEQIVESEPVDYRFI